MTLPISHWGASLRADGTARLRLWAPAFEHVQLQIAEQPTSTAMTPLADGWHELVTPSMRAGTRYWFRLPDGTRVADPASAYQPEGVWGPSELIDLDAFEWVNRSWTGRPWVETIIYELHVGTFTPTGTFRAAIDKLPHLVALGVTAIELMPVAAFPGKRNWGYDGVFVYAPAAVYGRPEELQALVDAAHGVGIMVFLDVVYNHLGPEGNLLGTYAPSFFTGRHHTPWGAGFNFEGETAVRQFFIENALFWLDNYHFDGLRFDAVHAIKDDSREHIIDAISTTIRHRYPQRHVHLILENEHNEAHRLQRENHRAVRFTAQWNDDLHHVLHVAVTNEAAGYYGDYRGDPGKLARAIAEGFAFQGEVMNYRQRRRGEASAHLPPAAFVAFIQNHDQIGNRAFGDRLLALAPPAAVRAAAAVYLLLPQIPMLFMGEEWGSAQPFPFFCDFGGELGQAVVKGRREEFARFPEFASARKRELIPDPLSESTMEAARLRWETLDIPDHRQILDWYRHIITARRREIVPRLPRIERGGTSIVQPSGAIRVSWAVGDSEQLILVANLSDRTVTTDIAPTGGLLWQEGEWHGKEMGPWCVHWSAEATP